MAAMICLDCPQRANTAACPQMVFSDFQRGRNTAMTGQMRQIRNISGMSSKMQSS